MTGPHPDIGPELRALAQAVLERLDPAVRAAAAMAAAAGSAPGKCQQVWCPVCALAALANGEQHPLLTVVAEHSVALLTLLRSMTGDVPAQPPPDGAPPSDDDGAASSAPEGSRYEHIPITVEE